MKYLNIKFFRDIKRLWTQFLSVLIMAMISTAIFTGMSAVWSCMERETEQYFKDSSLADVWVYGYAVTSEDIEAVKELGYVEQAGASSLLKPQTRQDGVIANMQLFTISQDTKEVLNPVVQSGEAVSCEKEGIWIDEDYAREYSLKEGDVITLTSGELSLETEILGIVLDAENIFFIQSALDTLPDHKHNVYAYISEDYAETLFGDLLFSQIRISLKEDVEKETLRSDMKEILGERFFDVKLRQDLVSIWRVVEEQEQIQKMAILFSAVFILLSLLTMYTTMSRLVDNQILQIGTCKALGFSRWQIYLHYAFYGFTFSMIGGIIGNVVGITIVSPLVLGIKQSTLTLPQWGIRIAPEAIALWFFIVFICTISSVLTGRKIIRAVPAQTMKGIIENKKVSGKKLKRSKLSYEWLWTIRSIKMHRARFAMGVIAVAGSVVLMTAGIGVWDSIVVSYDDVYDRQYTYEYAAQIKSNGYEVVKEELEEFHTQYAQVTTVEFSYGTKSYNGSVNILSEGDYMNLYEEGQRLSLSAAGVCISEKMAKEIGVSVGSYVDVKKENEGETESYLIDHIVEAKAPQGIFLPEKMAEDFVPTVVYFDEAALKAATDSDYITGIISREEQKKNADTMLESIRSIMMILIFAAFLLSAVVIYNLGALNFMERSREYATMKVLGFYKRELCNLVLKDGILTTVTGMIFGIPASIGFLRLYIQVVSMESMEWTPYIVPLKQILIIVVVFAFSIGINVFISRKTNQVDMVEAMKSVD